MIRRFIIWLRIRRIRRAIERATAAGIISGLASTQRQK
jgi:hypothetical protein